MIYECYGCLSRVTRESGGRQRAILEFEAVSCDNLNCFLGGARNEKMIGSDKYGEVFDAFLEHGMTGEPFRKIKHRYLGETGFRLVNVYFDSLRYQRYQFENWYFLRVAEQEGELSGERYDCAVYAWGEEKDPEINGVCNLEVLPDAQAKALRQLYDPYIPEESKIKDGKNKKSLGAVAANTVFGRVDFYYVGAALCAVLEDQVNNEVAFFDLGTRVSQNRALIGQRAAAANSNAAIIGALGNIGPGNPQTIFLSHWHLDHCNALGAFANANGVFANANISNHTEWYVPACARPVFVTMQNAIPAAAFHAAAWGAVQAPVTVNGNQNIEVGKINFAGNHPHHQGCYVRVALVGGSTAILVGDTTYEGLPAAIRTNGGNGYTILQASHHGGCFNLRPANQNWGPARGFIPTAAAGAMAVYSADGSTHGHPNFFFKWQHQQHGYLTANEWQLHQMAQGGNNILFCW